VEPEDVPVEPAVVLPVVPAVVPPVDVPVDPVAVPPVLPPVPPAVVFNAERTLAKFKLLISAL